MQAVLDGPVTPDRRPEKMREHDQRRYVISCLVLDLPFGFAGAFDDGDGFQTGPVVPFPQPFHIVDDGRHPGFDPAIVSVYGFRAADLGVREIARLLLRYQQFDVIAQRPLVTFQPEDIVGFLLDDLPCDGALAAHRVDCDDRAFDRQQVQQLRDRDDLVGFVRDFHLSQHQALAGGEG